MTRTSYPVTAALPELSEDDAKNLLQQCGADEVSAQLRERVQGCRPDYDELIGDCLIVLESVIRPGEREPIPFFEATWLIGGLRYSAISDVLNRNGAYSEDSTAAVLRSFVVSVSAELQRILLRPQIEFARELYKDADISESGISDSAAYGKVARRMKETETLQRFHELYPVAVYVARQLASSRLKALETFLRDLSVDRQWLTELGVKTGASIKELSIGRGDPHGGGRSVIGIKFSDGVRVLYKPRSLANDIAYAEFLACMRKVLKSDLCRHYRVIDLGDHGWCQHVSNDQASRFDNPIAIGQFAAILHTLSVSDVHYDNVRFVNGVPVLVDAETILSAGYEALLLPKEEHDVRESSLVANSGLFPSPLIVPKKVGDTFVDVGVLGRRTHLNTAERQLFLREPFTPRMRVEYAPIESVAVGDEDVSDENETIAADFVLEVCREYRRVMSLVIANRELIEEHVRRLFSRCRVRVVLQDTIRYTNAIQLSGNQACAAEPSLFVAALARAGIGRDSYTPSSVLRQELEDMVLWDVPAFWVPANGTVLYAGSNPVERILNTTPIEHVVGRVHALNEEIAELNAWMIALSFAPYYSEESNQTKYKYVTCNHAREVSVGDRVEAEVVVRALGKMMLGHPDPGNGRATAWLGARLSKKEHQYWYPGELTLDTYAGSPGIALVLAYGQAAFGDKLDFGSQVHDYFAELASVLDGVTHSELDVLPRGALAGIDSACWALSKYAHTIGDAELHARAVRQFERFAANLPQDVDVMSGIAGMVLLGRSLGCQKVSDDLTGRLVRMLESDSCQARLTMTGFAHGLAGYIYALAGCHGDGQLVIDARNERNILFDRLVNDKGVSESRPRWPIGGGVERSGRGWCSGTPGILLSVASSVVVSHNERPYNADDRAESLVGVLTEEVTTACLGGSPTLCHGDVGNLWVLGEVARLTNDSVLARHVESGAHDWVRNVMPRVLDIPSRSSVSHSLFAGIGGPTLFALATVMPELGVKCPLWLE